MEGILTGFAIIAVVVLAGYGAARLHLGGPGAQYALNRLAFFIAMPALMFTMFSRTDISALFQAPLAVQATSMLVVAAIFLVINAVRLRLTPAEATVGAVASGYVNSNNIGLPVATFVLDDPTVVVPVILLQLLVVAPITLLLLDAHTNPRGWGWKAAGKLVLLHPVRNPIILGSAAGALVSALGWTPPPVVYEPLSLLGGAAIPMMLMGFGMSLHGSRPLRRGSSRLGAATASVLKAVVMPLVALVLTRWVFGLDGAALRSAVLLAALPTAQNVYNYAARYNRGDVLARDTILVTTVVSPIVLLAIALLL